MGLLEPRANGTDDTLPTAHVGPPSMRLGPPARPRVFAARSPLPLLPAGLERLHPHAADAIAAAIAPPGMGPPRPAAPRDSALDTAKSIRGKGERLLGGDKAILAKMNPEPDLVDFLPPQVSIGYKYFRNTVKAQQARRPEPAEPRAVPRAAPPPPSRSPAAPFAGVRRPRRLPVRDCPAHVRRLRGGRQQLARSVLVEPPAVVGR